ncbi:MAG: AAA family ATPase [Planctomycetes bacterium]|nr:AAA family ATPase [Planctomycetota bacterium]
MSNQLQELRGTFRRLAWASKGEGRRFCIASVDVEVATSGEIPYVETVSVKGDADPNEFVQGLGYRFWGKSEKPNEFGKQFAFKQLKRDEPHSRVAVVGYLTRFATGIGPVFASQLWDAFGTDAVRVLRTDPDRAALAIGIPASRARDASQALNCDGQNEDLKLELVQLFDGRKFPKKLIEIVIKKWGLSAPQRIRRDPFTLLVNRLPGCGFARCDRLYVDLGLPLDRLKRQFACIWKSLKDDGDGHTWHPIDVAAKAVMQGVSGLTEGKLNWQRAVRLGVRAGWLRVRKDDAGKWWIAEAKRADNEASVAADMRRLMGSSGAKSEELVTETLRSIGNHEEPAIGETNTNLSCCPSWPDPDDISGLTDHQRDQLKLAFRGPLAILTGDPGTGKTTAVSLLIRHLCKTIGSHNIYACSPTNMAAKRLRTVLSGDGVQDVVVTTFHKLLGAMGNGHDGVTGWDFFYNRRNPLPCKVLLVDEDSMRDVDISASLLESLRDGTLVLFLGDTNQLPPVGHGAPLRDGIAARIPHGHFTEILRNSGSITEFCRAAREGKRPQPPVVINIEAGLNWKHFEASQPASQKSTLSTLLKSLSSFTIDGVKVNPIRDAQIIVGLNEKGDLSRASINVLAQSILNPLGAQVDGNKFRVGDKVICQDNCKLKPYVDPLEDDGFSEDDDSLQEFVSNGEMGIVTEVHKKFSVVRLDDERVVRVPAAKGEEDSNGNFDLAYAVTFHKSQGSQWKIVFLLSDRAANRLGSRELWNTGGSRPTHLLVTIGELATIQRQCQRVALRDRKTFLKELICDGQE